MHPETDYKSCKFRINPKFSTILVIFSVLESNTLIFAPIGVHFSMPNVTPSLPNRPCGEKNLTIALWVT